MVNARSAINNAANIVAVFSDVDLGIISGTAGIIFKAGPETTGVWPIVRVQSKTM